MKILSFAMVLLALGIATHGFGAEAAETAPTGLTPGRAKALVGAMAGLGSVIIGALTLARAAKSISPGRGRTGAVMALVLGFVGIILSVFHLSQSTGGFGTGGGRAGAIVALVLGLIGANLGGLALARSRRSRHSIQQR